MNPQIFNDLIDESPPSTVDIDAIFARERRSGHRRRWAGAGTIGLLVVALAAGTVVYAGRSRPGTSPPEQIGQAAPPPSTPTLWPPEVVARLEQEMREVVPRVVPGAQMSNITRWEPWGPTDRPDRGTGKPDGTIDGETYGIAATVTIGGHSSVVRLRVTRNLPEYERLNCDVPTAEGFCDPDASHGEGPWVTYTVRADKLSTFSALADHRRGVAVAVEDVFDGAGDSPLFTQSQLRQIVADPALVPTT